MSLIWRNATACRMTALLAAMILVIPFAHIFAQEPDPGAQPAVENDAPAAQPDATLELPFDIPGGLELEPGLGDSFLDEQPAVPPEGEEEEPNLDALDALRRAQQALFLGDYDAAFEAMDEALGFDPTYVDVFILRSLAHRVLGEYQQAVDAATTAIELDPEVSQAYHSRALSLIEMKQIQQAVSDCGAALEINPNDASAMMIRGTAYFVAEDYEKAVTSFTDALSVSPQTRSSLQQREAITAVMRRGSSWYHLGEYDIAIDDFDDVARISGVSGIQDEAYRWRGFVLAAQGAYLPAIRYYDRALNVNGQNSMAYKNRGIAFLNLGSQRPHVADFANSQAIKSFNQVIRLKPDDSPAYYYRGVAYSRLGEPGMAHSSFSTAAQLDPDHREARMEQDALSHFMGPGVSVNGYRTFD